MLGSMLRALQMQSPDVPKPSLFLAFLMYLLPGEGKGNPLQYSCLENPVDRGAWWAMVHGVRESRTQLK